MSEKSEKQEEEEKVKWQKHTRLPAFDKVIPIIKSMLLMVEGEKKRTLEKIEQTKQILEKLKEDKKR